MDKPLRIEKIVSKMINPDGRASIPFVSHGGRTSVMHVPPASVWRIVYDRRAEENLKGQTPGRELIRMGSFMTKLLDRHSGMQ
jgi:hypothetical protein